MTRSAERTDPGHPVRRRMLVQWNAEIAWRAGRRGAAAASEGRRASGHPRWRERRSFSPARRWMQLVDLGWQLAGCEVGRLQLIPPLLASPVIPGASEGSGEVARG